MLEAHGVSKHNIASTAEKVWNHTIILYSPDSLPLLTATKTETGTVKVSLFSQARHAPTYFDKWIE